MEHSQAEGLPEVPEERKDGVKKFVLDPIEDVLPQGEQKMVVDSISPELLNQMEGSMIANVSDGTTHVIVDDFVSSNGNRTQKRNFKKKFRKQYPWIVAKSDTETLRKILRELQSVR